MYMNGFLGMEFTEEQDGVVFHFLNGEWLAEEYIFKNEREATGFYMMCMRFFDEFKELPVVQQQHIFREFLDSNVMAKEFEKRVY